jgi:hypothetical protein
MRQRDRDDAVVERLEPDAAAVHLSSADDRAVERERRLLILEVGGCRRLRGQPCRNRRLDLGAQPLQIDGVADIEQKERGDVAERHAE